MIGAGQMMVAACGLTAMGRAAAAAAASTILVPCWAVLRFHSHEASYI